MPLSPHPTPSLYAKAMSKKDAVKALFPFIPLSSSALSHSLGGIMCVAVLLVVLPVTRQIGAVLSGCLSVIGWVSQKRMGVAVLVACC